ncbi:MAG: hypothetical protein PVF54_01140 [Anaerolineae bacterium]|jgi:hypothetical protein
MAEEEIPSELEGISPRVSSEFDAAWNARDAEALASLFHEVTDFQFCNALMLRGRRLIQGVYASSIFPTLPQRLRHKTRAERLGQLSGTVALGDGKLAIVDATQDDEQERVHRMISATIVLTKAA